MQDLIHPDAKFTEETRKKYQEQGGFSINPLLTSDATQKIRNHVSGMLERVHPAVGVDNIIGAHTHDPVLLDLCAQPRLLDIIEQMVGPDVVLWSSHIIAKPPRTGAEIPWHQDAPYWNIQPWIFATIWLALDDTTPENGPMYVLPGSHRNGEVKHVPMMKKGKMFHMQIDPALIPEDVEKQHHGVFIPAGSAECHDALLYHRSDANISDKRRCVMIIRYMSAQCDPASKQYTRFDTNEPFEREYYLMRGRNTKNDKRFKPL